MNSIKLFLFIFSFSQFLQAQQCNQLFDVQTKKSVIQSVSELLSQPLNRLKEKKATEQAVNAAHSAMVEEYLADSRVVIKDSAEVLEKLDELKLKLAKDTVIDEETTLIRFIKKDLSQNPKIAAQELLLYLLQNRQTTLPKDTLDKSFTLAFKVSTQDPMNELLIEVEYASNGVTSAKRNESGEIIPQNHSTAFTINRITIGNMSIAGANKTDFKDIQDVLDHKKAGVGLFKKTLFPLDKPPQEFYKKLIEASIPTIITDETLQEFNKLTTNIGKFEKAKDLLLKLVVNKNPKQFYRAVKFYAFVQEMKDTIDSVVKKKSVLAISAIAFAGAINFSGEISQYFHGQENPVWITDVSRPFKFNATVKGQYDDVVIKVVNTNGLPMSLGEKDLKTIIKDNDLEVNSFIVTYKGKNTGKDLHFLVFVDKDGKNKKFAAIEIDPLKYAQLVQAYKEKGLVF